MSQHITGNVMDSNKKPIGGTSVILQTIDSVFVESGITDENGYFTLKQKIEDCRILFQHIAYYDTTIINHKSDIPIDVIMKERNIKLKGIDILAKPPLIKLGPNGGLIYNVSRLTENSVATNALELLGDIPGITKNNDSYNIAGVSSTTILINGHKTNMKQSDLENLLSQTLVSSVNDVEIYYNTPTQMGVNGSSINFVLQKKRSDKTKISGDAYTTAYVGRKFYEVGGIHLGITHKKWSFDFGYGLGSLNKTNYAKEYSNHTLNGVLHEIFMPSMIHQSLFSHRINGRFSMDFKNKSQLTLTYDVKFTDRNIFTSIPITDKGISHTESNGLISGNDAMHVATAEYVHKNLTIGGDFVFYDYKTAQDLRTSSNDKENILTSDNSQKVNHATLYFNNHNNLFRGTINYGMSESISSSDNHFWNKWKDKISTLNDEENSSSQDETSTEAFVSWSIKIGKKTTMSAGVKAQYFRATQTSAGIKCILWENIDIYPSFNFNHTFNKSNSLLFTISTNREYPRYYITSESKRYHNTYKVDISNTSLKPYTTYEVHLNNIWKGKYNIGVYTFIKPNAFLHYTYQHQKELSCENSYYNCKQFNTYGFIAAFPYNWNKVIQSKFTSDIYYFKMKGEFGNGNIVFNRHKISGVISLVNSIRLLEDRSVLVELGGGYHLPSISGISNIEYTWNTNAAIVWNPQGTNLHITLKAIDILNTSRTYSHILWSGQNISDEVHNDIRSVNLNLRYIFNAFKQKKVRQVDTTRMTALNDNNN